MSWSKELSQATYPGYIRQERAKRQGHMGEQRLAELLHALGVPFEPKEKLKQPLSPDVKIWDVSFDLVVPNSKAPKVLVQSDDSVDKYRHVRSIQKR